MRALISAVLLIVFGACASPAEVVVFWQDGFPTRDSQPVSRGTLEKALSGQSPVFAGVEDLKKQATLDKTSLLRTSDN